MTSQIFLTEVFTLTEKPGLLQKKLFFYDFFISITSKVYTRRTYDEAVILQSCFLDVLTRNTNLMTDKGFNFLMNVLPDVYIFPLRRKSASLFSEGTVKCTNLAAYQIRRGC